MATDNISATVDFKSDKALRDMGLLGRKAKETGRSFNEAGRTSKAASESIASGTSKAGQSAAIAAGGFAGMSRSIRGASSSLAVFGVAAGVVTTATGSLFSAANAASRLNEQMNGAKVTFGSAASIVQDFSKTTANGLGISASAALKAANMYGAFFKQAGFAEEASAKMSTTLVQLAGDLASLRDVDVDTALGAISSGFAGESEPLRRLGVDMRITKVDAEVLASGLANTRGEISETDRTTARYITLLKQAKDAQGDFARTANEYANAQRRLNASTEDFKANIGRHISSGLSDALNGVTAIFKAIETGSLKPIRDNNDPEKQKTDRLTEATERYRNAVTGSGADSKEAAAALAELRLANDEAEKKVAALGLASETTAMSLRRGMDVASEAAGTLRGFVDAQRGAEDAHEQTLSTRRSLQDAEHELSELRRRGKVDAEKVADAERSVASATRSVYDARREMAKVEEEIAKLRAGPTQDEAFDADAGVTGAQIDLDRARRRKEDADREAALSGRKSPKERADALIEQRAADLALAQAIENLSRAEEERVKLNERALPHSKEMIELEGQLESARQREALATQGLTDAEGDLREARVGDPEFERNLAGAVQAVADARRAVEAADIALPFAIAEAKRAQDGMNLTLGTATEKSDALWASLDLLIGRYRDLMGLGSGYYGPDGNQLPIGHGVMAPPPGSGYYGPDGRELPVGHGVMAPGRARGGPVLAGHPYVVGEKRAEMFVPDSNGWIMPDTKGWLQPSPNSMSLPGRAGQYLSPSGGTSVSMHINAPLDAGTAATIEYAARVVSWKLDRSGRR